MTTPPALLAIILLKAMVEIAVLSLLAYAILGVVVGPARQTNVIYQLLRTITGPVICLARKFSPGVIADAYVGVAAFALLFWCWLLLVYAKAYVCQTQHLACFNAP